MSRSDPRAPDHLNEKSVRDELTRVFDVCNGCRQCVDLCASFPTLFDLAEHATDGDVGQLSPFQQDQVVDACHQCKLCALDCPYTQDRSELDVDVPRLMLRAHAMRRANGQQPLRRRIAVAAVAPPITRLLAGAPADSPIRRLASQVIGVSAVRLLPPRAKQRFSTWFRKRPAATTELSQETVTIFSTCHVEHHAPEIGQALVGVLERNAVGCSLSTSDCCGAPLLHSGDVVGFAKIAARNVAILADEARRHGGAIVVPQPTCAYVLANDYVAHVGGSNATLVADRVRDACEFLVELDAGDDTELDTAFTGDVPERATYHASCHVRARQIGLPGARLLELMGIAVGVVQQCSGTVDTFGLRTEHHAVAIPLARRLGERLVGEGDVVIAGDCGLANIAIEEQTGRRPLHPIELLARAYGLG